MPARGPMLSRADNLARECFGMPSQMARCAGATGGGLGTICVDAWRPGCTVERGGKKSTQVAATMRPLGQSQMCGLCDTTAIACVLLIPSNSVGDPWDSLS
jgi:hypothetical protein